jgi:hypothetical protein
MRRRGSVGIGRGWSQAGIIFRAKRCERLVKEVRQVIPYLTASQLFIGVLPADALCPTLQNLRASSGDEGAEMDRAVHGGAPYTYSACVAETLGLGVTAGLRLPRVYS